MQRILDTIDRCTPWVFTLLIIGLTVLGLGLLMVWCPPAALAALVVMVVSGVWMVIG